MGHNEGQGGERNASAGRVQEGRGWVEDPFIGGTYDGPGPGLNRRKWVGVGWGGVMTFRMEGETRKRNQGMGWGGGSPA